MRFIMKIKNLTKLKKSSDIFDTSFGRIDAEKTTRLLNKLKFRSFKINNGCCLFDKDYF